MFSKRLFASIILFSCCFCLYAKDKQQKDSEVLTEVQDTEHKDAIKHNFQRQRKAYQDMNYVYEREQKHTVQKEKLPIETLQEGINDTQNESEVRQAAQKIMESEYKSHLFLGLHLGATFTTVADNVHVLPTINLKIGFQNFLGIVSKQVGLKIYLDSVIASNILESLKNDPLLDFIDTTFTATNINAEVIYELPVSTNMRFGFGAGFGIGYMTYHDEYWDKFNGFASNISAFTYLSVRNRHKIELGYRVFFSHYGNYITRKLGSVVEQPNSILSPSFAKPMCLTLGWTYVF